jgi:uncharacterized repeat protein (TIGR03803 family)
MKSKMLFVTAITFFAALVVPVQLVAQEQQQPGPTFTVLHAFTGLSDGAFPSASLVRDNAGNLYGTAAGGGAYGHGVVFKLGATGKETVLHSFTGGKDGAQPEAGLVRDVAGNLYGTTRTGGVYGYGVVFKLDTTSKEIVLHSFTGGADGANPNFGDPGLLRDVAGNLYGTTGAGGDLACRFVPAALVGSGFPGCGVVFKLDTTSKETVLHRFTGGADGADPATGLVRDAAGTLYGTTFGGGDLACGGGSGCGVVFKLDTTGKETVLHKFTGGADGAAPSTAAGLVRDTAGNLYGTTFTGGHGCFGGCGVVFKLGTTGKETVLHTFTGGADGAGPEAGLVRDNAGNLYGTTDSGGDLTCGGGSGCGVVFKLDTTGKETVLHTFTGGKDGAFPAGRLIQDSAGNLYGTAQSKGAFFSGVVFKLTP